VRIQWAKVIDIVCTDTHHTVTHLADPDSEAWFILECYMERTPMLKIAYNGDDAYLFVWNKGKLIRTVDIRISAEDRELLDQTISKARGIV
jgi:hypothetical protein